VNERRDIRGLPLQQYPAYRFAHAGYVLRLTHPANRPLPIMKFFRSRPLGITIVGLLMVLFGLAEVTTAFTHDFFGIKTSALNAASYLSALIGALYAAAGVLVLTMKRRPAAIALLLLAIVIVGRIVLVGSGLYPTESAENTLAIIAGTTIVAVFAVYIALKWRSFSE